MALNLNEYIKMSYERPNRKVLEGLGASENLIEYLMETPGNTNFNMIESIGSIQEVFTIVWLGWNGQEYIRATDLHIGDTWYSDLQEPEGVNGLFLVKGEDKLYLGEYKIDITLELVDRFAVNGKFVVEWL